MSHCDTYWYVIHQRTSLDVILLSCQIKRLESKRAAGDDERQSKSAGNGIASRAEKVVTSMMTERQNAIDSLVEERERCLLKL